MMADKNKPKRYNCNINHNITSAAVTPVSVACANNQIRWNGETSDALLHCQMANSGGGVENGRGVFAVGGQTNEFLQFRLDLICLPMYQIVWTTTTCQTQYS